MADRRAKFEKKFRNVWATGDTGVSYLQMTTIEDPNELIANMFHDTVIADEWNIVKSVKRSFAKNGNLNLDQNRHHLTMITSDDRVAEAIEMAAAWSEGQEKKEGVPFDMVVVPLATGSKDYIDWVKEQTLKKDDGASYFNDAAPKALKAETKKVDEQKVQAKATKKDVEDDENVQTESKSTDDKKSLWSGNDPEDDEDDE